MSLLETAEKFNKQHDAAIKAEQESIRQAELAVRRQAYYEDYSAQWFQELSQEIDNLIQEFNRVTGDHSKLKRVKSEGSENDDLVVVFIRNGNNVGENSPKLLLSRDNNKLHLSLEVQNVKRPTRHTFEVLVKKWSSFEVRVISVVEKTQVGEGIEWKDRNTGEMNYEPTFYTKRTSTQKDLGTKELADYVLSLFSEGILESGI
jgi:hypothetical protein